MDNSFNRNWINLSQNVKMKTEPEKREHIGYLLKRRSEKSVNQLPQFIQLIHCIRTMCIIKAYFPNSKEYDYDLDIYNHPGINDFMTTEEEKILNGYIDALSSILKYKNTKPFDYVDKKFGTYRYKKWINSQK